MTYLDMITEAITTEGGRKGCSLPTLKKYIQTEYKDLNFQPHMLRTALKSGVEKEVLKQVKGHYKVAKKAPAPKAKKAVKKPATAAAKKPATKKPAAKKPAAAAAAVAKKTTTKKPAAKKPAAKKPAKKPAAKE